MFIEKTIILKKYGLNINEKVTGRKM